MFPNQLAQSCRQKWNTPLPITVPGLCENIRISGSTNKSWRKPGLKLTGWISKYEVNFSPQPLTSFRGMMSYTDFECAKLISLTCAEIRSHKGIRWTTVEESQRHVPSRLTSDHSCFFLCMSTYLLYLTTL